MLAACGSAATDTVTNPPGNGNSTVPVAFLAGSITAELATTTAARDNGLMNRAPSTLGANAGMLFVFATPQNQNAVGFHMVNTQMALSVAFLDVNKKVMNIEDMAPNTSTVHLAAGPFLYAIEANQGWFAAHNVKLGETANFTLPAGTIVSP